VLNVSGKGVLGITHILDSVGGGAIVTRNVSILVQGGGLRMENVVCWSDTQQNVSFYDKTGLYNEENLITGCLLANGGWGAFSFNNSSGSQEKTCMTIENSTLVNLKGSHAIVRQQKAIAANVELGENVTLMDVKGSSATGVASGILVKGMKPVKQEQTETLTILDKTFENLYGWKTGGAPAKPAPANPLDRVTPFAPTVSADPKPEQQPYAPTEPSVEAEKPAEAPTPAEPAQTAAKGTVDMSTVLGLVNVVLDLVLIILLLKKKKD
jgi:hypothetical protein